MWTEAVVVLGAMPTDQLTAMLRSTPPQHAAGLLIAMRTDRVAVLLASLDPPDLARILAAADPEHRAALVALLDVERFAPVLAAMSKQQAVELLAVLSEKQTVAVLAALPPNWITVLLTAMPTEMQDQMLAVMPPQETAAHRLGMYRIHVGWALNRTAAKVTWITGDQTADLLVDAHGWAVVVAIRYLEHGQLTSRELVAGPAVVHGVAVSGTLIVTNTPLSDDVIRYRRRAAQGPPVDVVTWRDRDDDGALHRATVGLVHAAGVMRGSGRAHSG